jgi:hypothetical protein
MSSWVAPQDGRLYEIKHNLAETPKINHNLAKKSGRAFWLLEITYID